MKFQVKLHTSGIDFGEKRNDYKKFVAENEGIRAEIIPTLPESKNQRRYFEGAVIPMWTFLDGLDYKDHSINKDTRDIAHQEFLGELKYRNDKPYRVGTTSKGKLKEITESTILFLEEQYGIDRMKVLNPDDYDKFIDEVYMDGHFETYIDYLIFLNRIPLVYTKNILK